MKRNAVWYPIWMVYFVEKKRWLLLKTTSTQKTFSIKMATAMFNETLKNL
jgi:hypothetical protein